MPSAAQPGPVDPVEWSDEDTLHGDFGWPQPPARNRPRPIPPPPRRRRRVGAGWVLALLGVVLAVAAGVWYARIGHGSPSRLTVPSVVGMKEGPAIRQLRRLGLAVRAVEMPGQAKTGTVFLQRPAAGTTLPRGTAVTIDVASGK